jgi:hypothetical protein
LLKNSVDDVGFTTAVEKFVESVGLDKLGENARSSRKASIALLKMDMSGDEAPRTDPFSPEKMEFSFVAPTDVSSSFSHHAVANNTTLREKRHTHGENHNLMQEASFISNLTVPRNNESSFQTITDEAVEENAIHDLQVFIAKAKQAKESAHNMKVRDQRIKQGYLSNQDREELLGETEHVVLIGGGGAVAAMDEMETESEKEMAWGRRERKKPYRRYDAAEAEEEGFEEVESQVKEATLVAAASKKQAKPRSFSNTIINRTAAKVIQGWVRKWLITARRKDAVGQEESVAGSTMEANNIGQFAAAPAPTPDLNNLLLSALTLSQTSNSNGSNDSNVQQQLLSLLLSQQQQRVQQQQQQQQPVPQQPSQPVQPLVQQQNQAMQPYSTPYPPPVPYYQSPQPSQDELAQLREELSRSKSMMENRIREVEREKEREMSELVRFKEAASAHLRAQNMTIKRLTARRDMGTVPVQLPVHESIMERVKKGGSGGKKMAASKTSVRSSVPFNYSSPNHY